jgi:Transposase DDE domain
MILPPPRQVRGLRSKVLQAIETEPDIIPIRLIERLPLAHAVLGLFHYVFESKFLDELFQRCRARSYVRKIDFPTIVQLLGDAITRYGTIHQALQNRGEPLPASARALYGKISRLPLSVSLGLLDEGTQRLQNLLPATLNHAVPSCFDALQVLLVDGKKSKNVSKRLLACRNQPGKVFGAKLVVALDARTRLLVAAAADADGERNDNPLVPALLERLRERPAWSRLFVCDSQFCDLTQVQNLLGHNAQFVFRHHPKTHFHADAEKPARIFTDGKGRTLIEEWGFLGSAKDKRRCYVRRLTWKRDPATHQDLCIVTNLTDVQTYLAEALIDLYLLRWKIETVFQQVATVFGMKNLIGSTPEASGFETAMCMLMYNTIQVVKSEMASQQQLPVDDISGQNLFLSVQHSLIALYELLSSAQIAANIRVPGAPAAARQWLVALLIGPWKTHWKKARNKNPRRYGPKPKQSGAHTSIERLRRKHKDKGP